MFNFRNLIKNKGLEEEISIIFRNQGLELQPGTKSFRKAYKKVVGLAKECQIELEEAARILKQIGI